MQRITSPRVHASHYAVQLTVTRVPHLSGPHQLRASIERRCLLQLKTHFFLLQLWIMWRSRKANKKNREQGRRENKGTEHLAREIKEYEGKRKKNVYRHAQGQKKLRLLKDYLTKVAKQKL